jgi:hypothetical protein
MRSEIDVEAEKIRENRILFGKQVANVTFKADFLPIRYGFGSWSRQIPKDGQYTLSRNTSVWGVLSFGIHDKDAWMSPYVPSHIGIYSPLTTTGAWSGKKNRVNFLGNIGIGAIFPYGLGLELSYDYSTISSLRIQKYRNCGFPVDRIAPLFLLGNSISAWNVHTISIRSTRYLDE